MMKMNLPVKNIASNSGISEAGKEEQGVDFANE